MKAARAFLLIALVSLASLGSAHAIVLGQLDDFEDGTTFFWANGGAGAPPVVNITGGGPAGADDNFLQVTSDGAGPGRFLTVFNRSQWLGNYISAGVTAISLDLRNQGATNLTIRLAFKSDTVPGAPSYITTGFALPAGSGWQHATFSIALADLTALAGPAAYNTFFSSGIAEVRIINSPTGDDSNGQIIVGQLGVDNVLAIPEPSPVLLVVIGLLGCGVFAKRGRVFSARR